MSRKNARKPLDVKAATALWNLLDISVEKFRKVIRTHDQHTFVGYAQIKVSGRDTIPGLQYLQFGVVNCAVKLWSDDRVTVQFPEHEGDNGNFYPDFFPQTAELRAVITLAVQKDSAVLRGIEAAAKERASAQESETENDEFPFSDEDLAGASEEELPFGE